MISIISLIYYHNSDIISQINISNIISININKVKNKFNK